MTIYPTQSTSCGPYSEVVDRIERRIGVATVDRNIDILSLAGFYDKQVQATKTALSYRYTLFGGSRGPGKSYWLRWFLLYLLIEWAKQGHTNVDVMLACEDYPSLTGRQVNKIDSEFPSEIGELKASKEKGLGFHLAPRYGDGSILLRNLDKPEKYQSFEFAAIAIDELTKNPESTFNKLRGSLRWPGIPDTKFIAATNPEPGWVREYWIERRFPEELQPKADQFAFVAALPEDNPHLSEAYWEELRTLSGPLRQAWLEGDWYAAVEGLVFDNFTDENVTEHEPDPEEPIEIAIDDGYIDPRAVLFIQRTDSHILVFDEIYKTKQLEEETIADIIDKCDNAPWADGRKGHQRLPEMAAVSHEAVALRNRLRHADIPSRNWMRVKAGARTSTRVEAIKVARQLFCDGKGHRTILVHRRCRHLLDEIRMGYKYPEDVRGINERPEDGNDHACEALSAWCWLRVRR